MPTGLIRRGARYSIRRRVPLDLVRQFGCHEIVRALGTSDPREARRLLPIRWASLDREFDLAREHKASAHLPVRAVVAPKKPISDAQAAAYQLARDEHERDAREQDWRDRNLDDEDEDPRTEEARIRLAVRTARANWQEERDEARRLGAAAKVAEHGPLLPSVIERWSAERKPSVKTVDKASAVVVQFYTTSGVLPITSITADHIQSFKEHLLASGGAPATSANKLNLLRAVMRYARDNRLIKTDPCDGIVIKDPGHAKEKRITYDEAALALVFGSSIYVSDVRPVAGGAEAAYWLPLLSLYTGARLNELGQLRPRDIAQETYIGANDSEQVAWVIRFVKDEAEGLTLKNDNSIRRVPVHSELVRLGFLRFVELALVEGNGRLFTALKPDKYGVVTAQWSKWYGRHLRKTGVTDSRVTFHSFRHTFKHYARYSGLAPDVQNEITGHETGDVGDSYGGLSYPLLPLVQGIERYRVPKFKTPQAPPAFR